MRALLCLGIGLVASATMAQNFEIVDQRGRVTASAAIQRGQLLVVESTGERVVFRREPRYDSADGRLLGFYNVDLQRALRFPREGRGVMQVADLDRPNPRFQNTMRSVRPSEVDPVIGYVPHNQGTYRAGPAYGAGLDYGSGGYGAGYGSAGSRYASSFPYVWGYNPPQPRSVLIESKTVANPPLEPAKLELANGGPREILVTIVDLKTNTTEQRRIRPSERVEINVARDAGGKRLQRYQSVTLAGDSVVKEVVSEIRPAVRYEIIVHEWVMQSIAIDRTGKSPSVIEDVNFQGKGLGRFTLPPGNELQPGTLDVYQAAISVANRGSIAPITAQEKSIGDGLSPLERAIENLQRNR